MMRAEIDELASEMEQLKWKNQQLEEVTDCNVIVKHHEFCRQLAGVLSKSRRLLR